METPQKHLKTRLKAAQGFLSFDVYRSEMASIHTTLAIIAMVFLSPVIIPALLLWRLFYDVFYSELPPGIEQPLKLRFFHALVMTTFILVSELF